jgi:HPt (histidine-containing phosphotransfer) domain-containing protein
MDGQSTAMNEQPDIVLDLTRLRKNCSGNNEIVTELLDHLQLKSGPRWMAALKDGLQSDDSEKVREVSHSMKGASATIFAWRISNLAQEFESLARDGEVEKLKNRIVELEQAFDELKNWLSENL